MHQLVWTLILITLFVTPAHGSGNEFELTDHAGENIVVVEVSGAEVSSWEMKALLPVAAGDSFSPGKVREGVLNLYRTGLYEHVDLRVQAVQGGVALRYEVVPRRWLEEVDFEGNLALSDGELIRRVNFRKNEEITEVRLRAAYGTSGVQPGSNDAVKYFEGTAVIDDQPGVSLPPNMDTAVIGIIRMAAI